MARLLSDTHADRWLNDVFEAASAVGSWKGFKELKLAIEQNATGQPANALASARQAEAIFDAVPNRAAWTRAKLEEVYALHRLVNGRSCFAESIELQRSLQGRGYAWIEMQAAMEASVCATMLGDFSGARPPLLHAHALAANGYENLNLRALGLEAALETVSGNTPVAWSLDRSGLMRYFNGTYAPQRGYQFYSDLSFVAQRWGQWHLAALLSHEAEDVIAATRNQSMTAMAAYRHGMLANAAGLNEEASTAFVLATKVFSTIPASDSATAIYRTEGEVSRAAIESNLGQLAEARAHLSNAQAWISKITDITVLLRYYQTLGIVLLHDGDIDKAQLAFEKAISLSRDGYSSRQTANQRASWAEETAKVYRGLTELLLRRRNQPEEALRIWEEYRSNILQPGVKLRIPAPQLAPLNRPSSSSVLTYTVFAGGVGIWVFDGQRLTPRWVDVPEAELRLAAERFAGECADPTSSEIAIARDGRWLYDRLIRPVAGFLPAHQPILLEPDGPTTQLPFAALPGESAQYFGNEHPITISLGPATDISGEGVIARSRALIVGPAPLGAAWTRNFPPLPDATREAKTLASLFLQPTLLTERDANYAAVRRELPLAEIFHFAGHAISDGSGGALLLADESGGASLGANEIETLPLRHCRLAVLSACSTAAGDGAAYAEGLAGAFLRAGARQVVAVRWVVDSAAARQYTEVLYRALLAGVPLEQAMYRAASDLRQHMETAHPSFWAGFEAYAAVSPWKQVHP